MTQIELKELKRVVDRLLGEDRQYAMKERRAASRHPFFRPARLVLERDQERPLFAFVRDISEHGIGLVHYFPMEPGRLGTLHIHRLWADEIVFRCEIRWCREWGRNWFTSGWKVIALERD